MRILLAILLFPVLASAQEKAAQRTFRTLFLNPPPDAPASVYLHDGTTVREIELPKMNFSDVYQVPGGDLNLRLLSKPVSKPEEIPAGTPSGKAGAGMSDFYLIVTADRANPVLPLKIQIIDAGTGSFRLGQMMWYNLTPNAVGGRLGDQKLAMKGQSRVIIDAPAKGAEPFDVSLSYLVPDDPTFHPICQTKWLHDPRSRMVMFVYGGGKNSIPEIAGFKDFREPPAKAE